MTSSWGTANTFTVSKASARSICILSTVSGNWDTHSGTNLVVPEAADAGVLLDAASDLDVLVGSVQVGQALPDVRVDHSQSGAAHHDTWSAHAVVVLWGSRHGSEYRLHGTLGGG